jgi:hypothetical protein
MPFVPSAVISISNHPRAKSSKKYTISLTWGKGAISSGHNELHQTALGSRACGCGSHHKFRNACFASLRISASGNDAGDFDCCAFDRVLQQKPVAEWNQGGIRGQEAMIFQLIDVYTGNTQGYSRSMATWFAHSVNDNLRKMFSRWLWLPLVVLLAVPLAWAQAPTPAPTPTTSTLQISVGTQALGLGTSAAGTDVVAKVSIVGPLSLRSDNILVPSTDFQFYGGGFQYNVPTSFLAKTNFSALQGYVSASVGASRVVPATGPSTSHVGFLAGGGFNWLESNNMIVNIVEIRWMHAAGNPSGENVPVVSGGLSFFF